MSLLTDPQLEKIITNLRKFPDIIMHLYIDTQGSWFVDQLEQVIIFTSTLSGTSRLAVFSKETTYIFALSYEIQCYEDGVKYFC